MPRCWRMMSNQRTQAWVEEAVGMIALISQQRYTHDKQFKHPKKTLRISCLGRLIRYQSAIPWLVRISFPPLGDSSRTLSRAASETFKSFQSAAAESSGLSDATTALMPIEPRRSESDFNSGLLKC